MSAIKVQMCQGCTATSSMGGSQLQADMADSLQTERRRRLGSPIAPCFAFSAPYAKTTMMECGTVTQYCTHTRGWKCQSPRP